MRRSAAARRLALALALACALPVLAPTVAVADDTTHPYVLDSDSVRVDSHQGHVGAGTYSFDGYDQPAALTWYRDTNTGRLRAHLLGQVTADIAECGATRATWTYGDGSTSTADTAVSCRRTERRVDFDSLPLRDAVRVTVELRSVSVKLVFDGSALLWVYDGTPPDAMTVRAWQTALVMDGTSGNGSCAKVDLDNLDRVNGSGSVFTGSIMYFCDATGGNDLRARIVGVLRWNDAMSGDRAQFVVQWRFAGAVPVVARSGFVTREQPFRVVVLTSPAAADVLGAHTLVTSAPAIVNTDLGKA